MGLDTSHNCWHGAYSSFAHWRNDIGRVIGWAKRTEAGQTTDYVIPEDRVPKQAAPADETVTEDGETYTIKWSEGYDNSVWLGHWDKDPEDVIDVLMLHSDCEGIIPHRFCGPLAARLNDLLPDMDEWTERTNQFINGLLLADDLGEDVDFH
jgi:hypothetical protein